MENTITLYQLYKNEPGLADLKNQPAKAIDWGFTESKSGEPQFWVNFKFEEVMGDHNEPVTGKKFYNLNDDKLKYFLQDLKSMGYIGNSIFDDLDRNSINSFNLGLKTVYLTTEKDKKGDKTFINIKYINETPFQAGIELKPLSKEKKSILNAALQAKIMNFRLETSNPEQQKQDKFKMFESLDIVSSTKDSISNKYILMFSDNGKQIPVYTDKPELLEVLKVIKDKGEKISIKVSEENGKFTLVHAEQAIPF